MDVYAGREAIIITSGQISEEHRDRYNSYGTRTPGPISYNGGFQGSVSCDHSSAGHTECVFVSNIVRGDSNQASSDSATLMYELRAHGEA